MVCMRETLSLAREEMRVQDDRAQCGPSMFQAKLANVGSE